MPDRHTAWTERLQLLEGLNWAVEHRIEIAHVCHEARDSEHAITLISELSGQPRHIAEAIREMRFRRFVRSSRELLQKEIDDLRRDILTLGTPDN